MNEYYWIPEGTNIDKLNWLCISIHQKLSEDFIRRFQHKVNWENISAHQKLSESFIREFKDKVDWYFISIYQNLSENFIQEFQDKVVWLDISSSQNLSEDFIREFQDKVHWTYISKDQILSESFIREFQNKVYWDCISKYQTLSEDFIREFYDKLDWILISKYQVLSEDFIREFQNKVYWDCIYRYQKLSDEFIKEFHLDVDKENNWLYVTEEQKEKFIKKETPYEILEDKNGKYIVAYKTTKKGGISVFKSGHKYEVGKIYESNCDCNLNINNSFGLSAWTKEKALEYYSKGELYKVKIYIRDIGAILKDNNMKIRCFKQQFLERVKK